MRARFGSGANQKVKHDNVLSYRSLVHILCKTYKWKIDYVLSLNIRQIKELLAGEKEMNEFIGQKDVKNPAKGKLNNLNDFIKTGAFKIRK